MAAMIPAPPWRSIRILDSLADDPGPPLVQGGNQCFAPP
jgi:hypothetical protein